MEIHPPAFPSAKRLSTLALIVALVGCGSAGDGGQGTAGTGGAQATGIGGMIGHAGATGAGGSVSMGGTGSPLGGKGGGGTIGGGSGGVAGATGNGVSGSDGASTGSGGTKNGDGGAIGGAGTAGTGRAGSGGASTGGEAGIGGAAGMTGAAGASGAAGRGAMGGSTTGSGGDRGGAGGAAAGGTSGAAGANGYMPCPLTPGSACAILPLGDSITEGYLPTGGLGGYRVELFSQAVLGGKDITFVGSQTSTNAPNTVQNRPFPKQHEGHDGYTIAGGSGSSGISGSITDQAMASYHPNIVLLMIGTNDVNGNIDVANAPTRLGTLIDELTTDSPSALVVVASVIPIASGNNSKAMAYNAAIPGLVSTRAAAGKHVIFVDNYAAFVKDPNYQTSEMSNYLHPNTTGYAILGDAFYGAIGAHLP